MKHFYAALALTLAAAVPFGTATAQDATVMPDLKGNWVGTSETIVMGSALHHGEGKAEPRLSEVVFTLAIKAQDGRRFWGTVSSPQGNEVLLGVIGFDGKSIVARDGDGYMEGDLADDDTMNLIYSHSGESTVIAATTFKRQD